MKWIKNQTTKTLGPLFPTYPDYNQIREQFQKEGLLVEPDIKGKTIKELIRTAIIAELDAINLYEAIVENFDDKEISDIINHVIVDEKHHIGEFKEILDKLDPEQEKAIERGQEEAKEVFQKGKDNEMD